MPPSVHNVDVVKTEKVVEVVKPPQKVIDVVKDGLGGPVGPQGIQGIQGPQGNAGPQGNPGIQGPQGDPGLDIDWKGPWLISGFYAVNAAVENNGSSYICISAHTSSSTDEPGVGANWGLFWDLMAEKGDAGPTGPQGPTGLTENSKSMTVENPSVDEDLSMFFTDQAITISRMQAVLRGSASPSVTWTIRHSPDRSAAGNEVVTGGTITTSTSTGTSVTSFDDATIPANSFVWVETTAGGGVVDALHLTLDYTVD